MDGIDSGAHDEPQERAALLFACQMAAGDRRTRRRRVLAGYFIEKRTLGYEFALAGEHRAREGHEWRPTLRWTKAAARRRLRRSRS